jgi:putative endonuclease
VGYYLYIVECSDGSLYTGWTTNIEKRLKAHNSGKGAKYTRTRKPVTLKYVKEFPTKSAVLKMEYRIKQLPRNKKITLIQSQKLLS